MTKEIKIDINKVAKLGSIIKEAIENSRLEPTNGEVIIAVFSMVTIKEMKAYVNLVCKECMQSRSSLGA